MMALYDSRFGKITQTMRSTLMGMGVIFFLIVMICGFYLVTTYFGYATNEEIGRLQIGMTKEEVISIVGQPDIVGRDGRQWYYYVREKWNGDPSALVFDEGERLQFLHW